MYLLKTSNVLFSLLILIAIMFVVKLIMDMFRKKRNATVVPAAEATPIDQVKQSNDNKLGQRFAIAFICIMLVAFSFWIASMVNSKSDSQENTGYSNDNPNQSTDNNESKSDKVVLGKCGICGQDAFYYTWENAEPLSRGHHIKIDGQQSSEIVCGVNCDVKFRYQLKEQIQQQKNNGNRLYDENVCSLCNGTGIEKNRSSLSNEYGRVCPMCKGKGRQSY